MSANSLITLEAYECKFTIDGLNLNFTANNNIEMTHDFSFITIANCLTKIENSIVNFSNYGGFQNDYKVNFVTLQLKKKAQ